MTKGKGKRLSDAERMQIIEMLESPTPPKMRKLARDFGVDEGSIRYVNKTKDTIKARNVGTTQTTREATYRHAQPKFPELEAMLLDWLSACRKMGLAIPPSLLQIKAVEVASKLGIPEESFSASNGWLQRFLKRSGIRGVFLFGEGGGVDKDDPELLGKLKELETQIETFNVENIYNMDETGLFYRMVPNYTLLMPDEDISTARGKKVQKDRVTLSVCCNATGSHKIPLHMIGKPAKPACIVGREWPLIYHNQKRAWMDRAVFMKWFDEVFYPEVRRKTGRPVLLLLDNAPGHDEEFVRNNVTVKFFPPNVTSWKQPMDMGIIAALKKRYKYRLLRDIIAYHDLSQDIKDTLKQSALRMRRGAAGIDNGKSATLYDAAQYAVEAWSDLSEETLKNCFIKADIIPDLRSHASSEEPENLDDFLDLFRNCSLSSRIEMASLAQEIHDVCHLDDESGPEYQQIILDEINDIIEHVEEARTVPYADEDEDDDADDLQVANVPVASVEFSDVIDKVMSLSAAFQSLQAHQVLPEPEMNRCADDLRQLQASIKRANSALLRKKMEQSRQLTLHDYFS